MRCGGPDDTSTSLRRPARRCVFAAGGACAGALFAERGGDAGCAGGLARRSFLAKGDSASRALITFLGHSSYQIDTPQGVRAITDYNGVNGFGRKPDIVTMNNAHSTHFTDDPEDGITYALRGWPFKPGESEAKHDVTLKDMKVWNVPTNARDWGSNAARINGNSIFIYAIADLCIAHLGHLHHRLTKEHLDELGRIDVLMVPIDGSFTMGQPLMVDVIRQIQPDRAAHALLGPLPGRALPGPDAAARCRLRVARSPVPRGRARGAAGEADGHRAGRQRRRLNSALGYRALCWGHAAEPVADFRLGRGDKPRCFVATNNKRRRPCGASCFPANGRSRP